MINPRALGCALIWLTTTVLGCSGGANFTTKFASDFAPAQRSVSVLGVYQDGRMALGSWAALAPYLVPALGPTACPVFFDSLMASNQDLANAIDEYARDDAPTDGLLKQLAPAAQGDLILVLTFAGKLPEHAPGPGASPSTASSPMGSTAGAGRGRRHGGGGGRNRAPTPESTQDPNQLDISASLFSVAQQRSVAFIGMQYHGESVADAMTKFANELLTSLPGLKCTGWSPNAPIDPAKIHASIPE